MPTPSSAEYPLFESRPITRILIVGSGWVGRQIAVRAAMFGITAYLTDRDDQTISAALQWCRSDEARKQVEECSKTRFAETLPFILASVSMDQTETLKALAVDLVIECVPEQIGLKKRVLREVSSMFPAPCIITSNSSYFVPSVLSPFVEDPSRFAHLHFHVPVIRPTVVDIVGCEATDPEVIERLRSFCVAMEQTPLVLNREHPGYIFNWLLQSVLRAALELSELDVASMEQIDRSWTTVTGMPKGPFQMMDQIGLDVIEQVLSNSRWRTTEPVETEALLARLRPLVAQGKLGIKSGQGFYDYRSKNN